MPMQYKILLLVALLAGSFLAGWKVHSWKTDSELLAELEQRDKTIAELHTTNDSLMSAYLVVADQITNNKITIVKEKIKYVPVESDAKCVVNVGSVWLWNRSLKTSPTSGADGTDATPRLGTPAFDNQVSQDSGIELSEVVETGSLNNQTALTCIARLKTLQDVVRSYQEKTKEPK